MDEGISFHPCGWNVNLSDRHDQWSNECGLACNCGALRFVRSGSDLPSDPKTYLHCGEL